MKVIPFFYLTASLVILAPDTLVAGGASHITGESSSRTLVPTAASSKESPQAGIDRDQRSNAAGQAAELNPPVAHQEAPADKWLPHPSRPKRLVITHRDGRNLPVILMTRTESEFTFQRERDFQIFTLRLDDLSPDSRQTLERHWDPSVRFPHFVRSHTSRCVRARRCR